MVFSCENLISNQIFKVKCPIFIPQMDLYISNDLPQCENFQSFCQKFEILKKLENFKFQLGSIFMNEFSRENAEISQCFRKSIIFKYLKSAFQNHHFFNYLNFIC